MYIIKYFLYFLYLNTIFSFTTNKGGSFFDHGVARTATVSFSFKNLG